jgi:hypothetical protein
MSGFQPLLAVATPRPINHRILIPVGALILDMPDYAQMRRGIRELMAEVEPLPEAAWRDDETY